MSDALQRVREAVARWDDVDPEAIDVRAQAGEHGTLVFAAREAAPGESDDDRWFAARAIYVDAATDRLFRLPGHAAFMPAAETYLAASENRARCAIEEDA